MFSSGARGLPLFSIRARTHTLRSKLIRDTPSRTSVSTFSDEIARQSDPSTRDVPSFASSRDFVRVSSQLDLKEGCSFVSLEWISVFGLETGLADRLVPPLEGQNSFYWSTRSLFRFKRWFRSKFLTMDGRRDKREIKTKWNTCHILPGIPRNFYFLSLAVKRENVFLSFVQRYRHICTFVEAYTMDRRKNICFLLCGALLFYIYNMYR